MAIREIITVPDPRLKQKSAEVLVVDEDIKLLAQDMFDTMYEAGGIGLAAIQVGVPKRVIVIDVDRADEEEQLSYGQLCLINPKILSKSEECFPFKEGCLSVPKQTIEIIRPSTIVVAFLNLQGEMMQSEADGILARCIQHEIDHLNGKVIVDYLSSLKRKLLYNKIAKHS